MASHLGTKRHCMHCASSFYDLNRTPVVCPKCKNPALEAVAHALYASEDVNSIKPTAERPDEEHRKVFEDLARRGGALNEDIGLESLEEISEFSESEYDGHDDGNHVDFSDDADDESVIEDFGDHAESVIDRRDDESGWEEESHFA